MDFLGIGLLELLLILVLGFLVLGPDKMVKAAQRLGTMLGELQGNIKDLSRSASIDSNDDDGESIQQTDTPMEAVDIKGENKGGQV